MGSDSWFQAVEVLLHQLDGSIHLLAAGQPCARCDGNRLPLWHYRWESRGEWGVGGGRSQGALLVNILEGKAVVLVIESWASEMAFSMRFLLACLAGGRVGLEQQETASRYSPAGSTC